MEKQIFGKLKKYGDIVEISNYGVPVWAGQKRYDVKIGDKFYKKVQINGRPERLVEVSIGSKGKKNLMTMDNIQLINYLNNKVLNIKRKKREFKELFYANALSHNDFKGDICLPKMLTITFLKNVQNYDVAMMKLEKLIKRFETFVSNFQGEKFKLIACGVKEFHEVKRDGYHFHFICFNVPYIFEEDFTNFFKKEHDKFGRLELATLKGFNKKLVNLRSSEKGQQVEFSSESIDYLSKSLEYLSKDLENTYKLGYSVTDLSLEKELLIKLQKECGKTVLYKTGKLLKAVSLSLESEKEFEDNLLNLYSEYSCKNECCFFSDFLGWVDLFTFFVPYSNFINNVMEKLGLWDNTLIENKNENIKYNVNNFFINEKENKLMYVDNKKFIKNN